MKKIWISMIAAGLLTIAAIAPVAGQDSVTLELESIDDSGVGGNVLLTASDGQTDVEVLITAGLEDGAVHPVHIHAGTCDELGDVVYPLDNIEGGVSETSIDAELMDLLDGNHAVNVHLSEDALDDYVACADIPEGGVGGPGEDDEEAGENGDDAADDDEAAEDDEVAEDDENGDDAADDDEASEDEAADENGEEAADDAADEDDAAEDEATDDNGDEESDEAADEEEESVVPAAGSVGGPSGDTIALMVALMAGSAFGVGVLIRRQAGRTRIS